VGDLLRTLFVGLPIGRWCRVCDQPIGSDDPFGLSERVCRPCRDHSES
jgi:hypothetical protein